MKRFESVPNFSEGRDAATIDRIAHAARSVPGVRLLDVERNADHNRSVFTLVGEAEPLLEALDRMIRVAVASIDLNHHTGEHPRMGAVDVVPIVPFGEATVAEAVACSERLAHRVWTELGLPVYLYAQSAKLPEHRDLAVLRRGGFEGIRASIGTEPDRRPDVGEPRVHPTAGIVAIGARPVLIAYNAYLATADVAVAKAIAHVVRERDGGLPAVKALGFEITERHQAQVSMNLVDYRVTGLLPALDAVRREAEARGTRVVESEIVGMVPEDALLDAAEGALALAHFDRSTILERRISEPEPGGAPAALAGLPLSDFTARVAARTPTPGGGSAAAATAAIGAALGEMVVQYSRPKDGPDPELTEALATLGTARVRLLELVDEDARSYDEVRGTKKARAKAPDDPAARMRHRAALRKAAEVPLETVRCARSTVDLLERIRGRVKPSIASDLTTGTALLRAAIEGAAANVRINLADLEAEGIDTHGLAEALREETGGAA